MSVEATIHFRNGLEVLHAGVHPSKHFATITIGEINDEPESGYPSHPTLYFQRVEDIATLASALFKLGRELDAAKKMNLVEVGGES